MTCVRWDGITVVKSSKFLRIKMRNFLIYFLIFTLPNSLLAADKNIIGLLEETHDVGRLEFSLLKLRIDLTAELNDSYYINSFNDLYSMASKPDYQVFTFYNDQKIFVSVKVNDRYRCIDKNLLVPADFMPTAIRMHTDKLAAHLMQFFGHFGEYENINIYGQNIVHLELAKLFIKGPLPYPRITDDQLVLASEIGKRLQIVVSSEYCPANESARATTLTRTYHLNSDYQYDGNLPIFNDVDEQDD